LFLCDRKKPKMPSLSIRNEELATEFLAGEQCLQQSLPDKLGTGYSKAYQLEQDFSYIETRYTPRKDVAILSRIEQQEPRLVVTLGIKGHSRFINSKGTELFFKPGYTSITTFGSITGERQYEAGKDMFQLRFSMGKNWLDGVFGEAKTAKLFNCADMRLLSCQPISAQGVLAAQLLTACNVADEVKPVFRRGLATTVLAAELDHLFQDERQNCSMFSRQDQAKAMLARDILFNEFREPPSVADLARRAGTNQLKLKQLFHHYFNNTPYGLLLEIRMNHAYQLLKTGQYHVSIAADRVGYQHASNFSAAFTRYFGVSPKEIAKHH
jgi:AraC family transcriptional activator of pyochelin receptor